MAAITAALRALTAPGATLVVPADGYYQVRAYATEYLARQGVNVVQAASGEMIDAAGHADVVLAETPANPSLTSSTCIGWEWPVAPAMPG